jgi:hypothetical protein
MLLSVSLWACGGGRRIPPPQPVQFPGQPAAPEVDVDALLESLSLRDKIAQLVVAWIPGTYAAFDDEAFARMQAWVSTGCRSARRCRCSSDPTSKREPRFV